MLRTTCLGLASLLLLGALLPAAAPDGNWPRFRGPNGTGLAADPDVPTQWTDKDVLWKAPLPGTGNSSPVVWGDKLFIQSATADGSRRMMLCLAADTGKILWAQELAGRPAKIHPKNSLASSTPCTDGERVYGVFWDGQDVAVHAFDFSGKAVWKRDLGSFTSQHGVGASPVVHEGKVFVNLDQDGKASLIALDAKKGDLLWESKRKAFRACYSAPFVREKTDEGTELIVGSTAGLTGYNPQTGKENWHWTWEFVNMPLRTVGAPLLSQGLVIACSGDGNGSRHMVAVKIGGAGELPRDSVAWQKTRSGETPYVPCVLAQGDYLFAVNDRGEAQCYETKTGKVLWSEKVVANNVTASPILVNGHVYILDEDGEVAVVSATPTFKPPQMSKVGEKVMASPAVSNGKLYIRGKSTLYCIGKTK